MNRLKRCPFCYRLPLFRLYGKFWGGGCEEHIPDAVMQPLDMYDQAVYQWNAIVEALDCAVGAKQ